MIDLISRFFSFFFSAFSLLKVSRFCRFLKIQWGLHHFKQILFRREKQEKNRLIPLERSIFSLIFLRYEVSYILAYRDNQWSVHGLCSWLRSMWWIFMKAFRKHVAFKVNVARLAMTHDSERLDIAYWVLKA